MFFAPLQYNKRGWEITFNRLVVVDRIYWDDTTREGLDCLIETGFVKEIVYFSNFRDLADYFSEDPKRNDVMQLLKYFFKK